MTRRENTNTFHRLLTTGGGFTLVELLVVIVISGFVLSSIYSVFRAQSNAHVTNSQVVEMQQNLRAAMYMMEREIRQAGYTRFNSSCATITDAGLGMIQFRWDRNDDGDCGDAGEEVAYGMPVNDPPATANWVKDADRNGIPDTAGAVSTIGRSTSGTGGPFDRMANNIERLAFAYAYDNDEDGELDLASGNVIWGWDGDGDGDIDTRMTPTGTTSVSPNVALNRIRAVRVWALARSNRRIPDYTDRRDHNVGPNSMSAPNDAFMRRTMSATIKCRNMGLRASTAAGE